MSAEILVLHTRTNAQVFLSFTISKDISGSWWAQIVLFTQCKKCFLVYSLLSDYEGFKLGPEGERGTIKNTEV